MSKSKTVYTCQDCGSQFSKWSGQCGDCQAWNTLIEEQIIQSKSSRSMHYAGETSRVTSIDDVPLENAARQLSGISELDRVLGGGVVSGSITLIGGDPGIGKSTLLLQALSGLTANKKCLYVSGEESLQQIGLRAKRLGLPTDDLLLLAETHIEHILKTSGEIKPNVLVIDSIQTIYSDAIQSAPGSVSQVRECAAQLARFAKLTQTAVFIVGHVTKEGTIAGPRVLEHMVDTVLYFEGERYGRLRLIRAVKNRFGAVNELGVFAMTEQGLKEVSNPSAIFMTQRGSEVSGSTVLVTWEGTRPLLVEVQALVDQSHGQNPRRVTVGLDANRLSMLLAVLHRHCGVVTFDQDVFVNVVGGLRIAETATDLAVLLAIVSSLRNRSIPSNWVVFGEVGLGGEIRPIPNGLERLNEAVKQGFTHIILPKANAPKKQLNDVTIHAINRLQDLMNLLA